MAADEQRRAGDRERPKLGLDRGLADLLVAVVERQRSGGADRLLALLLERGRQDQVLTRRHVLRADDHLLLAAHEVVDVVQAVVLDVEPVAAEPVAVREQHTLRSRLRDADDGADHERPVLGVDRLPLRHR
jgi:hypothetical protein